MPFIVSFFEPLRCYISQTRQRGENDTTLLGSQKLTTLVYSWLLEVTLSMAGLNTIYYVSVNEICCQFLCQYHSAVSSILWYWNPMIAQLRTIDEDVCIKASFNYIGIIKEWVLWKKIISISLLDANILFGFFFRMANWINSLTQLRLV